MLLSDVCLTSVAYIGPKSRTEKSRKTKIGIEVAHVTCDSDTTFKVKGQTSRSPGRFGWLFKSLHNVYRRDQSMPPLRARRCLSIMNVHGARRAWRRRRKACRLWTGGGPQSAYSGRGGGILCRHAHSLFLMHQASPIPRARKQEIS